MAVLSELRYPTTRPAKVVSALLAVILFGFVSIATDLQLLTRSAQQLLEPLRTVRGQT